MPSSMVRRSRLSAEDRAARAALQWFKKTTRTEGAFYLRFQRLPQPMYDTLAWRWGCDDWGVFRRICSFFGVQRQRRRHARDRHLL